MNIHGASARKRRASLMSRPQLGAGGCVPKPRKESEASATTAAEKTTVSWTTIGEIMLRSIWESTIRIGLAPSARAAVT
jgi:hypothetical protein